MPSKLGFGNTRKKAGKASYGSTFHYKNPIKHTGAEMYSAKNNRGIDRGHRRDPNDPNWSTIIKNRLSNLFE